MRQARRIRPARHFDDLKRADGASRIVRIHAGRGFGILCLELVEQRTGAFDLFTFLEAFAHLWVSARKGNVVDGGTGVQTGTAHEDRAHSPGLQFGDFGAGDLLETCHGHDVVRFDDVDQVVPDLGLFLRTRLGGADIHALVHLVASALTISACSPLASNAWQWRCQAPSCRTQWDRRWTRPYGFRACFQWRTA